MSSTPLMKQYKEIKENHQNSILFFRLGDFYEMFYEDAKIASKILGIALTARNKEKENIPMAGVPFHSAPSYIAKFIQAGYKVSLCEQVEDAKFAKGLVKREVVKTITPGTFSDPDFLEGKENNYILSFCSGNLKSAVSYMDLTTGEFKTTEFDKKEEALGEVFRISPKELVLCLIKDEEIKKKLENYSKTKGIPFSYYQIQSNASEYLQEYFKINNLKVFDLEDKKYSVVSSASLLQYVNEIQDCSSVKRISYFNVNNFMAIDYSSQVNMNLLSNGKDESLFKVLDKTNSAMGSRFLRSNLSSPLMDIQKIEKRYDDIDFFISNPLIRSDISKALKDILDMERSFARVLRKEANIRDLNALKKSLKPSLYLNKMLGDKFFNVPEEMIAKELNFLESAILDSNATSIKEGGIIEPTFNSELNELYKISSEGKNYLLDLETKERKSSEIKGLKIKYNKIFGYFIEITSANLSMVPERYIRKQTLSNSERYITPELKDYEEKILSAKEKMSELEFELFNEIVNKLSTKSDFYSILSDDLAYLDFIFSLAEVAIKNKYVRPTIAKNIPLMIQSGRHPIVEELINDFVSNDTKLNSREIIILTGPNMSGKSTYMKQVALIVLLAQIGSFVPAKQANIPLTDRIFTRVGASDDLSTGQSTFMVEMNEVSNILNNATENSLVILDEVGRGTSTYDGISIAKATTEYLHDNIGAKVIFATHYHELNGLSDYLDNVFNYRFEVKELADKVVFLKKIVAGKGDKSYGIEVARLAGVPQKVLKRSRELLKKLEESKDKKDIFEEESSNKQILRELSEIDLDNLSPMDLFAIINKMKKELNK